MFELKSEVYKALDTQILYGSMNKWCLDSRRTIPKCDFQPYIQELNSNTKW